MVTPINQKPIFSYQPAPLKPSCKFFELLDKVGRAVIEFFQKLFGYYDHRDRDLALHNKEITATNTKAREWVLAQLDFAHRVKTATLEDRALNLCPGEPIPFHHSPVLQDSELLARVHLPKALLQKMPSSIRDFPFNRTPDLYIEFYRDTDENSLKRAVQFRRGIDREAKLGIFDSVGLRRCSDQGIPIGRYAKSSLINNGTRHFILDEGIAYGFLVYTGLIQNYATLTIILPPDEADITPLLANGLTMDTLRTTMEGDSELFAHLNALLSHP